MHPGMSAHCNYWSFIPQYLYQTLCLIGVVFGKLVKFRSISNGIGFNAINKAAVTTATLFELVNPSLSMHA